MPRTLGAKISLLEAWGLLLRSTTTTCPSPALALALDWDWDWDLDWKFILFRAIFSSADPKTGICLYHVLGIKGAYTTEVEVINDWKVCE
jgi:hypothetical protein